jgi:hypothetical protein
MGRSVDQVIAGAMASVAVCTLVLARSATLIFIRWQVRWHLSEMTGASESGRFRVLKRMESMRVK